MKVYGLIPARGGSKRIPRKNMELVGGQTLVGRAVQMAKAAHVLDEVWVSTDDGEIAAEAFREGASIVIRPAALAADETRMDEVVAHFIEQKKLADDDLVVILEPTATFRFPEDIIGAVRWMWEEGAPGLRTVTRRSDLGLFEDNGFANVISVAAFRQYGLVWTLALEVPGVERAIDIDTPEQLERARALS